MSGLTRKKAPEREIVVRWATEAESAAIAELIREAFGPFESEYTPEGFEYTTPGAEKVCERFSEGPIWAAFDNEVMVGTISGLPEPDRFYIRSMAIKPDRQRLGIGQKLLDTLEAFAREAGYEKLYLYTTFVLPGAKPLYEKNGFYVLRETKPEEWCGMGGLEMEKILSEPGAPG